MVDLQHRQRASRVDKACVLIQINIQDRSFFRSVHMFLPCHIILSFFVCNLRGGVALSFCFVYRSVRKRNQKKSVSESETKKKFLLHA